MGQKQTVCALFMAIISSLFVFTMYPRSMTTFFCLAFLVPSPHRSVCSSFCSSAASFAMPSAPSLTLADHTMSVLLNSHLPPLAAIRRALGYRPIFVCRACCYCVHFSLEEGKQECDPAKKLLAMCDALLSMFSEGSTWSRAILASSMPTHHTASKTFSRV